jgi:thiamine pyrophosphate-dependent acetolactate synthase large subunit-like protein
MRNGAEIVWEALLREGVETIFGIPGGAVIPLYHFMTEYPIRHVLMRHEQAAVHAADGFARATGRVGVCLTTSGPGVTNLVTGLATAQAASSPIIAIAGQAHSAVLGTDAFQEIDVTSVTEAVTKHNYLVTATEDLEQVIHEAFHIARSDPPGPVLVAITTDAQLGQVQDSDPGSVDWRTDESIREVACYAPGDIDSTSGHDVDDLDPCAQLFWNLLKQLGQIDQEKMVVVSEVVYRDWNPAVGIPRTLLTPGKMGTRGFALPAAIGVQIARPREQVWAIASEEGFQANIQELATIVQERLPLRIAVLSQEAANLGSAKQHRAAGPSFVKLAEAYGIASLLVQGEETIAAAASQAVASDAAILIDFRLGL